MIWKSMTDAEKQPFVDDSRVLQEEANKKILDYFANADPAKILLWRRAVTNTRGYKALAGEPDEVKRLRKESGNVRPPSSYFRFLSHFRTTPEGLAIAEEGRGTGKNWALDLARVGAQAWKALSEEEKRPYKEAAHEAQQEWLRDHPKPSA